MASFATPALSVNQGRRADVALNLFPDDASGSPKSAVRILPPLRPIPERPAPHSCFSCATWSQRAAGVGTVTALGVGIFAIVTHTWPLAIAMGVTTLGGGCSTYALKDLAALKDMSEYATELGERVHEFAGQVGLLGDEIKELTRVRDELQAKVEALEPQIGRLTTANGVYEKQNEEFSHTATELQGDVTHFQEVVQDADQKLASTVKAYGATREELSHVKDDFKGQLDQLSRINITQAAEVRSQKIAYEALQKDLGGKVDQFKAENDRLSETEKKLSGEIADLTTRLATLDKAMAEKVASLAKTAAALATSERKIGELWGICDELRKENETLAESSVSIATSAADIKKAASDLSDDERRLAEEVGSLDKGNVQLAGSLEQLKAFHVQLEKERQELEDLRKTTNAEQIIFSTQKAELHAAAEGLARDQKALEGEKALLKKGLEELDHMQALAKQAEQRFVKATAELEKSNAMAEATPPSSPEGLARPASSRTNASSGSQAGGASGSQDPFEEHLDVSITALKLSQPLSLKGSGMKERAA